MRHPGEHWLSWSATERNYFVIGYIQGYGDGLLGGCQAAEDTLRHLELKNTRNNHYYIFDRVNCDHQAPVYTKLTLSPISGADVSAYIDVITKFYEEHPEYREIPYLYLIQQLKGENVPTADDLNSLAHAGKIRTHW